MERQNRIKEIEGMMQDPSFWNRVDSKDIVKEFNELKNYKDPYENTNAVVSIFSGAGGDDAEDFANILFNMYKKYLQNKNWGFEVLSINENTKNGIKSVLFEVSSKEAFSNLKFESGIHRLVRISPFNAKKQRHTSFASVEVLPLLPNVGDVKIEDEDVDIETTRSGGPGGQNVNKRETAVRVTHKKTGIQVRIETERTQAKNKDKALEVLRGKLYRKLVEDRKKEKGQFLKGESIEWGNQIRSYVLHPYKLVKDHRTDYEESDVDKVFNGDIENFIKAFKAAMV